MDTRMIVLEFNELTPSLMHRFMSEGKLPHFKRMYEQSDVYTTTASEQPPNLDPWIQWVTVHTGLNLRDHGLRRLNEGHTLRAPRIWDLMSAYGRRVWVCGSMNVGLSHPPGGAILPDPWTTNVQPFPGALKDYFTFVQRQVMEHTSTRGTSGLGDAVRFLRFMLSHGLTFKSVRAVIGQLLEERRAPVRWKRAALLDELQFDVFAWYYRRLRPHFASFFLNSTAHYQHLYWREMDPSAFTVKPSEAEQRAHQDAIEYGYRRMDHLLSRVFALAGPRTAIVMATALSQQPCLSFEAHGGKNFYRPKDWAPVTALAGVTASYTASPVMAHQFHLYFADAVTAQAAADRLAALRFRDRQALSVERNGPGVFVGCRIYEPIPPDARLSVEGSDREAPFFDLFYKVDGVKSGMHHPDGMLWIRSAVRTHAVHPGHVPLATVAPTLLELCDVPRPSYMWPTVDQWSERESTARATA